MNEDEFLEIEKSIESEVESVSEKSEDDINEPIEFHQPLKQLKSFSVNYEKYKKNNRRSTLFALSQVNEGGSGSETENAEIDDFLLGDDQDTKFFGNETEK